MSSLPNPIEGVGLFDIAQEAVETHKAAFRKIELKDPSLLQGGDLNWRYDGEEHMWTPDAVVHLQRAVRSGSYDEYKKYAQIINDQSKRLMTIRG